MGKDETSLDTIRFRTKPRFKKAVKLGDVLGELTENHFTHSQMVFGPILENWEQLLPNELAEHCRITGIRDGQIKVLVDSSAYLYELRLCKVELIRELRLLCPRAKIKNISFVIG